MSNPPSFMQSMLPDFAAINVAQFQSTIEATIAAQREQVRVLLNTTEPYTWANLMQPLEEMNDELNKIWSPLSHLHAVMQSEELRQTYNRLLPLMTEFNIELSQNEKLYNAILSISNSPEYATLNAAQQKIIENDLRDFQLSGIHLPQDKKQRFAELQQQLSQLTTKFSENLLDATDNWMLHVTNEQDVAGLSSQALQLAMDNAKQRNLSGFVFTLDQPSYFTAIRYLKNRELRKTLYEAHTTRASDAGPHAGKWDNTTIMDDILKIRHELAQLIGFNNYADYSLATKMAKTSTEVLGFLNNLVDKSKSVARQEYQEIAELAQRVDGISELEVWDIPYYSEQLQQSIFNFTQEDVRPYFPIDQAMSGMFAIVNKLYGISIVEQPNISTWHPHAKFYAIKDDNGHLRGGFYIDLYARTGKRDGAWMDECRTRRQLNQQEVQYPVAYLTCNFMPPADNQPALLTHDDVLTLFHEFGHCLHHMLTKIDYPSVAGINGVPWDAVEFPSQFMENFCWEKESLDLIAIHYQTGEKLPDELFQKMIAAKNFQTGLQMVRQLEFSLFDFKLHLNYDPQAKNQVQTCLDSVRNEVAVIHVPAFNRFQHSFSHIFAGSYAAAYYSYKWAEVLSSDAYSQFEENGIFDRATGQSFMQNILEVGGVRDPMTSFQAFRGRAPMIDALLRHSGMLGSDEIKACG